MTSREVIEQYIMDGAFAYMLMLNNYEFRITPRELEDVTDYRFNVILNDETGELIVQLLKEEENGNG